MEDIGLLREEEACHQILNLIFKNLDDTSWNFRVNFFWRKVMLRILQMIQLFLTVWPLDTYRVPVTSTSVSCLLFLLNGCQHLFLYLCIVFFSLLINSLMNHRIQKTEVLHEKSSDWADCWSLPSGSCEAWRTCENATQKANLVKLSVDF